MTVAAGAGGWRDSVGSNLKQVGLVRLIGTLLFLLLGLLIARYAWDVPVASDVERALYDLRFTVQATRTLEPDERITLVTYNDDTLAALGKRSPLDRALLARTLRAIDGMGPRAIGIDILIDQAQPEDAELIATLQRMRTPTYLAFASAATNRDQILPWQEEFLRDFQRRAGSGPVRPASIRLEADGADGVIRRWPDQPRDLPPLLAIAMAPGHDAFRDYTRAIDFRISATGDADYVPVFTNLPIQFVAEFPEGVREMIAGRYVLIGGDIQDLDNYETPMTRFTGSDRRWTKGLEVHAHLLAQMLDGRMPGAIPGWALWIAAIGAVVAGALTALLEVRGWRLALVLVFQLAFFGYLPFLLQQVNVDTLSLPAFGWSAGWLLAFVGVGTAARAVGSEQRKFAQSALGKYLPPDVASQIMRDPKQLALHGEKKQIFALFTDLEGFTKLSHAITPEQLSSLLNRYLDDMSDVVLEHGGTIDKFVGDAVVAFWGAPIARADDGDRAVRAAIGMYQAGEKFAASAGDILGPDGPKIGCTRVGLHRGEAVVGNFGGEGRIQYTALGDGMNTAARLESANKALKTTILVSTQAKQESGLDVFRPMGRVVLSGRATPCEVWEPVPEMDAGLRAQLNALWRRYDGGDADALVQLEEIAILHKGDAALREFVYRIREAGPGGHFVLGSK
jgi:adenylate cyclase